MNEEVGIFNLKQKNENHSQQSKNPLLFFVGIAMLAVGLFWLSQTVRVSTDWFSSWRWGGISVPGGLTMVPLIAGIVWLFFNPKSFFARALTVIGGIQIVAAVIMSIRFYVHNTSLFVFLIIFVFIAGGSGLILRALFKK